MINLEDEALKVFIEESAENLISIDEDMLILAEQGDNLDYELVNCIFRAVHAVKGGAVFFGLERLGELAHHMEVVLDRIRRKELLLTLDMANSLLAGANVLKKMIEDPDCIDSVNTNEIQYDIEEILRINFSEEEKAVSDVFVDIKFPGGKSIFSVNKYDFQRAIEDDRGGSNVYLIRYDLIRDIEEKNKTPWQVISELLQLCVFIDSKVDIDNIGTLDSDMPTSMPFYVLISTIINIDLLYDFLELDNDNVFRVGADGLVELGSEKKPDIVESILEYIDVGELNSEFESNENSNHLHASPSEVDIANTYNEKDSVTIRREVLDILQQHAQELILAKDQIIENCECEGSSIIEEASNKIEQIVEQLQETVSLTQKQIATPANDTDKRLKKTNNKADKESLIIFLSGSERVAVPLGLVSKLEKVKAENIVIKDGVRFVDYKNKKLELIFVSDVIGNETSAESGNYIVAVENIGGKEIGLVFNSIVAILNTDSKINQSSKNRIGIVGNVNIKGRIIALLDIYQVIFAIKPKWNINHVIGARQEAKGVLIVENSEFFLEYIKDTLRLYGFTVYSAKGGQEALDALEDYEQDIGLIFTTIDMPDVGGVKFIQRLRDNNGLDWMQVIALTSVVGEELNMSSTERFFKEFVVKLDSFNIVRKCCEILLVP